MDLHIREITLADAARAAELSGELGYPVSPEVMQKRIASLSPDHAVYVACLDKEVAAWIDVSVTHHLQSDPRAEIGGLVVSSKLRSRGIGHVLVAPAEQWARERGLQSVIVRSQIAREAAHNFYLHEGYARTKTSAVFTKKLDRYFVSTLTT